MRRVLDDVEVCVARAVKVLRRLVENLVRVEGIEVLHGVGLCVQLLVAKLEVFVKAPAGRTSTRISRSLPLSLDALNDLTRFRIDTTKRINRTILTVRMHNSVTSFRDVSRPAHVERLAARSNRLIGGRMVHELRLVYVRRDAWHVGSLEHGTTLVRADVG